MGLQEDLLELYNYHEDGYFIRTDSKLHKSWSAGSTVKGCVHKGKAKVTTFKGKQYPLRSLVWAWHKGVLPTRLESIDGDNLNTRIENLREKKSTRGEPVTQTLLKKLFHYDAGTGELKRLKIKGRGKEGKVAGYVDNGYRGIVINGIRYPAANLVVLYLENIRLKKGETIDHINRNRDDNRRENLRIADRTTQQVNRGVYKSSKTGVTGVTLTNNGTYRVYISNKGVNKQVGKVCRTFEEAVVRRYEAERNLGWHELNLKTPAMKYVEKHKL